MNWVRLCFVPSATMALVVAVACCVGAPQAQAQFVCGGSADGSEPQDGARATAAVGVSNFACGTNANASSGTTVGANTAVGTNANASDTNTGTDSSSNVATGFQANASGNISSNTATGPGANASGDNGINTANGASTKAFGTGSSNVATGNAADAHGNQSNNVAIGSAMAATIWRQAIPPMRMAPAAPIPRTVSVRMPAAAES
jgi:hypothetical protein